MAFQDKNVENTSWISPPPLRLLLTAGELTSIDSVRETRMLKEPGSAFLGGLFPSFSTDEWKDPSIAHIYLFTNVLKSLRPTQPSINLPHEVRFVSSTAQSETLEHHEHIGSFNLTKLILFSHLNYTQNRDWLSHHFIFMDDTEVFLRREFNLANSHRLNCQPVCGRIC
jgi:hypothetical protein